MKGDFRLARVTTELGGVTIPAGTTVMVVNGAANHDPARFEHPTEFHVERANARQHIAFGHGPHTCPGAPLARTEGRITIERLLDRMDNIRISEKEHGPAGARRYDYVPTYILRGVSRLHLEFEPRTAQAVTSLERSTIEDHDTAASDREVAQIDDGLHRYVDRQQVSELHSQAP